MNSIYFCLTLDLPIFTYKRSAKISWNCCLWNYYMPICKDIGHMKIMHYSLNFWMVNCSCQLWAQKLILHQFQSICSKENNNYNFRTSQSLKIVFTCYLYVVNKNIEFVLSLTSALFNKTFVKIFSSMKYINNTIKTSCNIMPCYVIEIYPLVM